MNLINHWKCTQALVFVSLLSAQVGWAGVSVRSLLDQTDRPRVEQIEALLKDRSYDLSPLRNETELPKDLNKLRPEWQNHFPLWYEALVKGAPRMIASFEASFPGATWAFIGRDMAILADLFEAFYRARGQRDRVVRIGMSRGTMVGLTLPLAYEFLSSHGFQWSLGMHPFILVDAISRGGGRQARLLLNAGYDHLQKELKKGRSELADVPLNEWLPFFNCIGLRVLTTDIPDRPLDSVPRLAQEYPHAEFIDFNDYSLLTYRDPFVVSDVIGVNEAGYTHWTGAWHGSYGKVFRHHGKVLASQGEQASPEMKTAIVIYQAHVVKLAQSPEFLRQVEEAYRDVLYEWGGRRGEAFPLVRPQANRNVSIIKVRRQIRDSGRLGDLLSVFEGDDAQRLTPEDWNRLRGLITDRVKNLVSSATCEEREQVLVTQWNRKESWVNPQVWGSSWIRGVSSLTESDLIKIYSGEYWKDRGSFSRSLTLPFENWMRRSAAVIRRSLDLVQTPEQLEVWLDRFQAAGVLGTSPVLEVLQSRMDLLTDSVLRKWIQTRPGVVMEFPKALLVRGLKLQLSDARAPSGMLGTLRNHWDNLSPTIRSQLSEDYREPFFALQPNVHEMNDWITLTCDPNGPQHFKAASRALDLIPSRLEYKQLKLPALRKGVAPSVDPALVEEVRSKAKQIRFKPKFLQWMDGLLHG